MCVLEQERERNGIEDYVRREAVEGKREKYDGMFGHALVVEANENENVEELNNFFQLFEEL